MPKAKGKSQGKPQGKTRQSRSAKPAAKSSKPARKPPLRNRNPGAALRDTSSHAGIRAGQHMLTALGGRDSVVAILQDSAHPKATRLIERLQDSSYVGENFATSYTAVGLKSIDVLEIFGDVVQARVFINALVEGDEVVRSLIRSAKDQILPHEKCAGSGRVLDRKTGSPSDDECRQCQGSGYVLQAGSLEAQKTYLELVQWRKSGGLVQIDARRQQANVNIQPGSLVGMQIAAGTAPDPLQIIKRADQILLPAMAQGTLPASNDMVMPEDSVMEAETL